MADHPRLATMTEDDSHDVAVVINDTSTVAADTESNTATVECTSGVCKKGDGDMHMAVSMCVCRYNYIGACW